MKKVLHIAFDGYAPNNTISMIDINEIIDESIGDRIFPFDLRDFKTVDYYLESKKLWGRLFSGLTYEDMSQYLKVKNYPVRLRHKCLPKEVWIWNKLSDYGIRSDISMGYSFENLEQFGRNVNGFLYYPDFSSRFYREIVEGVPQTAKRDHKYYDLESTFSNKTKFKEIDREKFFDRMKEVLESESKNSVYEVATELGLPQLVMKCLDSNREYMENLVIPSLSKGSDSERRYVLIHIMELDAIYHFLRYFDDLRVTWGNFVKFIIESILNLDDFDTVIFSGDHGMDETKDNCGDRFGCKTYSVDVNGFKIHGFIPSWFLAPLFASEHSKSQGFRILSKEKIEVPMEGFELGGDALYAFLTNKDNWDL